MGFAIMGPLVRGTCLDPDLVDWLALLLHASFRPHLTATPLRFAITSPLSGCEEDLFTTSWRTFSAYPKYNLRQAEGYWTTETTGLTELTAPSCAWDAPETWTQICPVAQASLAAALEVDPPKQNVTNDSHPPKELHREFALDQDKIALLREFFLLLDQCDKQLGDERPNVA